MDPVNVLISLILGVVGGFFASYLNEKAKNFASKEDIAEIRDKEASVQSKYDEKIAKIRSDLDNQLHIQKLSFEKEFEILSKLWDSSVELRSSIPDDPTLCAGTDEEAEQRRKTILTNFIEKRESFRDLFEKNRPFYPKTIYEIVVKFMGNANVKAVFTIEYGQHDSLNRYVILQKSCEDLNTLNEELCSAIRTQLQPFTSLAEQAK